MTDIKATQSDTNPVKNAQQEVEALIQQFAKRLADAMEEQKLCNAELEKWRDVAHKLANVANISIQPAGERKSLKLLTPVAPISRIDQGQWKTFWTNNLTAPMSKEDAIKMGMVRMNADRNKATCALKRWISTGLIFDDGNNVVIKSYLG